MTDLESAICDLLVAASLGVKGTSIFGGPQRDAQSLADEAIFVLETGGINEPTAGATAPDLQRRRVQVIVRGARNVHAGTSSRAQLAMKAIHKKTLSAPFISIICERPVFIQLDQSNRSRYSLNANVLAYATV